jgi:hypothetical protein
MRGAVILILLVPASKGEHPAASRTLQAVDRGTTARRIAFESQPSRHCRPARRACSFRVRIQETDDRHTIIRSRWGALLAGALLAGALGGPPREQQGSGGTR